MLGGWDPLKTIDFAAEECCSSKIELFCSVISNISPFMLERTCLFFYIMIGRKLSLVSLFLALKM